MKHFKGDIFGGEWDGICHVANLYHTMGGGVARIIKERFPKAYEVDCATPRSDTSKLGTFSFCSLESPKRIDIFNLYGQMGMGNDGHPMNRNARYDAIYDGAFRICEFISTVRPNQDYTLAFPHMIGCGLAGGSIPIVTALLEDVESRFPFINFVTYQI